MCGVSGVARSLRPLPRQHACGPVPGWMSCTASPVSSETRSPVWAARTGRAWSRRPCQVARSGAASSTPSSPRVGADDRGRGAFGLERQDAADHLRRARGGAAPRSGTASGWRRAGRCGCATLLPRSCSRWSRKAPISGASRSARSSSAGGLPVWPAGEAEQQPPGVAVGGDGVRAGAALADEPVGEERLAGWGRARLMARRPAGARSSRSAARASSSGVPDRYQLFRYRNNWYYSDSRVIPIPAPLPA